MTHEMQSHFTIRCLHRKAVLCQIRIPDSGKIIFYLTIGNKSLKL